MARGIVKNLLMNEFAENENIINNLIPAVMDLAMPFDRAYDEKLFDYRDRGENNQRQEGFFENVIPRYNFNEFKAQFGMSPQTMQVLCESVAKIRRSNARYLEMLIPIEKKVLFAVWMLSKSEGFETAGDRFSFAKSTAFRVFWEVIDIIASMVDEHITWPTSLQQQRSSEVFKARSRGFGGIIGVVGACHIQIKKPESNHKEYYNKNQVYSVILQGICNEKCQFIDVSTGYPGSLHEGHVFRLSAIGQALEADHENLVNDPDHHLIGDTAYELTTYLLTPFRCQGRSRTPQQTHYNRKLASVRSIIKKCFARLKGKFTILKKLELTSPSSISKTVVAACTIHNMIIEHEGLSDGEYSEDKEDPSKPEPRLVPLDESSEQKRNHIAKTLPDFQ